MPTPAEVIARHDAYIDNLVGAFERELNAVAHAAQATVTKELLERLTVTGGEIAATAANRKVLRRIDRLFADAMERAGYNALVEEFAAGFTGQLPFFAELLEAISDNLQTPLKAKWTPTDLSGFEAQQAATVDTLTAVVDGAAIAAKRKALMNVNALPFSDLVDEIAATFGRAVPEAAGLAETASAMFFRTITDRGFEQIEADLPRGAVRYRFEGPSDKLTRPWCREMLARTKRSPLTRAQIEGLDNGQLPNPFITGGGYRCRHQWIVVGIDDK